MGHTEPIAKATEKMPSLFWGMMIFLSGMSMLYLFLLGYFETNTIAKNVATLMMLMGGFGVVLSAGRVFYSEKHIVSSSKAFLLGFIIWASIASLGSSSKNVLKMDLFQYFKTVTLGKLPGKEVGDTGLKFWEWFVPNVVNPINEEMLWGVGLPIFLILMMKSMANAASGIRNPYVSAFLRQFDNPLVQTVVLITVLPVTFAVFHVGKQAALIFIISAITFRSILTVLWWGDLQWDIVPFLIVVPSFLVGAHMGNNWGTTGIQRSLTVAISHPVGWATLAILGFVMFIGLLGIIEDISWLRAWLPGGK